MSSRVKLTEFGSIRRRYHQIRRDHGYPAILAWGMAHADVHASWYIGDMVYQPDENPHGMRVRVDVEWDEGGEDMMTGKLVWQPEPGAYPVVQTDHTSYTIIRSWCQFGARHHGGRPTDAYYVPAEWDTLEALTASHSKHQGMSRSVARETAWETLAVVAKLDLSAKVNVCVTLLDDDDGEIAFDTLSGVANDNQYISHVVDEITAELTHEHQHRMRKRGSEMARAYEVLIGGAREMVG